MPKLLNECTASEIVAGIASGRTTSTKVVESCLERIAARESEIAAWAHIDPEEALRSARESDRRSGNGALRGVPFGVKDIIDSFDLPTEWGTPIHKGRKPGRDAACVALSRKAGAVLLGKTVTTEFANLHPGPTRNPRDTTRSPGGSSSGSAAAVADMMVPLAIGTQTTGSTIRPSSFCGVVGYRPTYGEHRLHGVMEASGSLDTLGICARSVDDIALYRDVLLGIAPEPVGDAPPPRVGLCRTHIWDQVDPTVQRRTEEMAERLARSGAKLSEVDLPAHFRGLTEAHQTISSFEFARTFTDEVERHHDEISETLRGGRIAAGLAVAFEEYLSAQGLAERCRIEMDAVFEDYDVLLTPSATGEAPVGWNAFAGADLYKMWTVLHVPALSLPVFVGASGMPAGIQLFTRRHQDRRLFAHALWAWRHLS